MKRTLLSSFVILSFWSSLTAQALFAAPDIAQASGVNPPGTRRHIDISDLAQHWVRSSEE
jgi:hypothetical protein